MIRKLVFLIVFPVTLIIAFFIYLSNHTTKVGRIDYLDHLDEVAVTIDGEDIILEDLIFYILHEEAKVEKLAKIYNPDSTKDYWNTHTNGYFVDKQAKKTVIESAIHNHIMYKLAIKDGTVMTSDQKEVMEKARTSYWESLLDGQLERLPLSYEEGNRIIKEITIAEIYQQKIAEEMDATFAGLSWEGYEYREKILPMHKVKINDKVWEPVVMGEISLHHDKVNYINGLSDEEIKEIQDKKKNE